MHQTKCPPENPGSVPEIACDGNEKVLVNVYETDAPLKRAGRPPQRKKCKPYSNGWFMATDPQTGRILTIDYMHEPENNDIKIA